MNVLVTGATGFIGNRLCSALSDAGHTVAAMTRHPHDYHGAGSPVYGDIDDSASLAGTVADCEVAYYLVHSLARPDFEEHDRVGAHSFGRAAADAGVRQVIYLGGLGDEADDLSPHLTSRREVERVLRETAPTTALRAGVVIGDGQGSFSPKLSARRSTRPATPAVSRSSRKSVSPASSRPVSPGQSRDSWSAWTVNVRSQ